MLIRNQCVNRSWLTLNVRKSNPKLFSQIWIWISLFLKFKFEFRFFFQLDFPPCNLYRLLLKLLGNGQCTMYNMWYVFCRILNRVKKVIMMYLYIGWSYSTSLLFDCFGVFGFSWDNQNKRDKRKTGYGFEFKSYHPCMVRVYGGFAANVHRRWTACMLLWNIDYCVCACTTYNY